MSRSRHELTVGALDLVGRETGQSYTITALAEETDWGNPALEDSTGTGVDRLVQMLLSSTREMPIRIAAESDSSAGLALAESAIMAEAYRENTIRWVPPDGGEPVLWDVIDSRLEQKFSDLDELGNRTTWLWVFTVEPFARAEYTVTSEAITPATVEPTLTTIDSGESPSGWSVEAAIANADGGSVSAVTVTSEGGRLRISGRLSRPRGRVSLALKRAWSTPVDMRWSRWIVWADGALDVMWLGGPFDPKPVMPFAQEGDRIWFRRRDASAVTETTLTARVTSTMDGSFSLWIDQVDSSTGPPILGTGRQSSRIIPIAGSVPTPGRLSISGPTGLGDVLLYTRPAADDHGYQPHLSPFLTEHQGTVQTTDNISGHWRKMWCRYTIPAARFPEGAYVLGVRVRTRANPVSTTIQWRLDGGPWVGQVPVTLTTTPSTLLLGRPFLAPSARHPANSSSAWALSIFSEASADVDLDEAWLFNVDLGKVSLINAGAKKRLWLDTGSADEKFPTMWLGDAPDMSDVTAALSSVWKDHDFTPPRTLTHVVSTGAVAPTVTFEHQPRFHTRVTPRDA